MLDLSERAVLRCRVDAAVLAATDGKGRIGPVAVCVRGSDSSRTRRLLLDPLSGDPLITWCRSVLADGARGNGSIPVHETVPDRPAGIRTAHVALLRSREGLLGALAVGSRTERPLRPVEWLELERLAAEARRALLPDGGRAADARRFARVTARDRQIVELLAADLTCKEVAASLDLSTRTVEHHIARLKTRLHRSTLHGLIGYLAESSPDSLSPKSGGG